MSAPAPLWQDRRILVCLGTGGVGKTTVAASLGMAAARAGKKTLVMTIDPARRLMQALGLPDTGGIARRLEPAALAGHGVALAAPLEVLMPEVKGTLDALIARWAPSPAAASAILSNRIYQHLAGALAGAHEYAAVEKLYEVHASNDYDLIVLDTPPAHHAVDFLDAPTRLLAFLDSEALSLLTLPSRLAGKLPRGLRSVGQQALLAPLSRVAGSATLAALGEFALHFDGMFAGFRDRAAAVGALFAAPSLGFVLVGAPAPHSQAAMTALGTELGAAGLTVHAQVLNRLAAPLWPDGQEAAALAAIDAALAALPPPARAEARAIVVAEQARATASAAALAARRAAGAGQVVALPELDPQVEGLAALATLQRHF